MKRTFAEYCAFRGDADKVVNLGCGRHNKEQTYGIDIMDFPGVDEVHNLTYGIPLENESVHVVVCRDFLEHIPQGDPTIRIMEEIFRVLKIGGQLHFMVPSTDGNSMGAFQDPTHVSFWNQKKFQYFMDAKWGQGFRDLYDIKCWFAPIELMTYNNEHGVTYVRGVLEKQTPVK